MAAHGSFSGGLNMLHVRRGARWAPVKMREMPRMASVKGFTLFTLSAGLARRRLVSQVPDGSRNDEEAQPRN